MAAAAVDLQLSKVSAEKLHVLRPEPIIYGNQNNPDPQPSTWTRSVWLESHYHFEWDSYFDHRRRRFGVLRALIDHVLQPSRGFGEQGARDQEILTYMVEGEMTHEPFPGQPNILRRGDIKFVTAGARNSHVENNKSSKVPVRCIHILVTPAERGLQPAYGVLRGDEEARRNKWDYLISDTRGRGPHGAPGRMYQDANVYVTELEEGRELELKVRANRQVYLLCVEGEGLEVRAGAGEGAEPPAVQTLGERDALEIVNPQGAPGSEIVLRAGPGRAAHVLAIEMARSDLSQPQLKQHNLWPDEPKPRPGSGDKQNRHRSDAGSSSRGRSSSGRWR